MVSQALATLCPKPVALAEHVFIDAVSGRRFDEEYDSGSSNTGNQAAPEISCGIYLSVALLIGAHRGHSQ